LLYLFESDQDGGQPFYQAVSGFARSLHLETTKLKIQTLELAIPKDASKTSVDQIVHVILENIGSAAEEYNELKYLNGKQLISRFREWEPNALRTGDCLSVESVPVRKNGCYLVTGGAGGLGLIIAHYLIREHRAKVVLVGRSEQNPAICDQLDHIGVPQCRAVYYRADISKQDQVESLIRDIKTQYGEINGVFHCAGVIRDALVQQKKLEVVNEVLAPKVQGTIYLDQCLQEENLDFFILFSSISSQLGNVGQSDYAYANSFMDSFAAWREWMRSQGRRHGHTVSVNWPLWEKGGMSVDEHTLLRFKRTWGTLPLNTQAGLKALEVIIRAGIPNVMVLTGDSGEISRALSLPAEQQAGYEVSSKTPVSDAVNKEPGTLVSIEPDELSHFLREQVSKLTGIAPDEVDEEVEFWDIGIDSILSMQIIETIADKYGLSLYPNELHEHNTLKKLKAHLLQEIPRTWTNKTAASDNNKGKTEPLCFILSTPRAGSTLLRVMLMGNSRIFAPPELHLLQFNSLNERKKKLKQTNQNFLREGLIETIKVLEGTEAKEAMRIMEDLENKDFSVAETYRYLGSKAGDRVLVDKSPTYGENLDILRKAETLGFEPFYIFLVRHPLSMMASFVKNRFDRMLDIKEEPWRYSERLWVKINANVMKFLDDIPDERKIFIRYEDLVGAPEKTLKEVCGLLRVDFEKEMLEPYKGERMIHGLHQKSITIGDPGFLKHKAIVPERAEAWKAYADRLQELEPATTVLARELGYSLSVDNFGHGELPLSPAQPIHFESFGSSSPLGYCGKFARQTG
jgi:NAD(P)-dependent dehydrogenase (short-subunit alcohol dehydrogenase family)/acyl carrier protein